MKPAMQGGVQKVLRPEGGEQGKLGEKELRSRLLLDHVRM